MKKFLALFLSLILALCVFTACKPKEKDDDILPGGNGGSLEEDGLQPGSDNSADDLNWDGGMFS